MPAQLVTNPMLRLEPITSLNRIAEDHLEPPGILQTFQQPQLLRQPEDPDNFLFGDESPVEFSLADVVLYVAQDYDNDVPRFPPWDQTRILTVNPFTGAPETVVNNVGFGTQSSFDRDIGDLAFRGDGNLFAFSLDLENPNPTIAPSDPRAGNFLQIDTGDGTIQNLGDDGILTYEETPGSPPPGTPIRANLANGRQGFGVHFEAIDFGVVAGFPGERLLGVGNRGEQYMNPIPNNGVAATSNILYQFNPATGAQVINPGTPTLFEGDRLPITGQAATDSI